MRQIFSLGRSNLVDGKIVREYQVRWEGCTSKFDSWELQEKIQKADPAAVYRFNLEMAACFGTAKPRAGGGASDQQPIVPSENTSGPRRSARLKSSSNSVSNTAIACSNFAASSASSNSAAATASSANLASSSNLQSAVSKEEVKLWNF